MISDTQRSLILQMGINGILHSGVNKKDKQREGKWTSLNANLKKKKIFNLQYVF